LIQQGALGHRTGVAAGDQLEGLNAGAPRRRMAGLPDRDDAERFPAGVEAFGRSTSRRRRGPLHRPTKVLAETAVASERVN